MIFLGIYGHPPPDVHGLTAEQVSSSWTNQAIHFASSYATRSALWLKLLLP